MRPGYAKQNPEKPYKKTKAQVWRIKRGRCLIRSEDDVPPSRWEVAMASKSKTMAKLIYGANRRRSLPEVAALVSLAKNRYKWSNDRMAKRMGTNKSNMLMMTMGLIPVTDGGVVNLNLLIKIGNAADLGLVDVLEIYKRCIVPRQYEAWRSYETLTYRFQGREWDDQDARIPEGYAEAWNHFHYEWLGGGGESRMWHWTAFEAEMKKQAEEAGLTPEEIGMHSTIKGLLSQYYPAGSKPPRILSKYPVEITKEDKTNDELERDDDDFGCEFD